MIHSKHTIDEIDTELEHYTVVEQHYEGRRSRVLFSGGRQAAQSGVGLDDDPDLLFDYNQRMLEIANALYPKRILMLGGGAYTLPMALRTALPDAQIDVVELDPGLEPIARQYFGLNTDDHLRLHFDDGRRFLEAAPKASYDLIVIDVYSQLSIPSQFLTVEFVYFVHQALSDCGAVVFNIIASYEGKNAGLIQSQIAAYQSLFAAVTIFPAAHGLTTWLPQNLVLTAEKQPLADLKDYVRFAPMPQLSVNPTTVVTDATAAQLLHHR